MTTEEQQWWMVATLVLFSTVWLLIGMWEALIVVAIMGVLLVVRNELS